MKIISELPGKGPLVVTIGNFDGIHLGHRKLLEEAMVQARKIKGELVVLTFVPHPQDFFLNCSDFYINSFEERRELFKKMGVNFLIEINFNEKISSMSPQDFLSNYILNNARANKLILGHDFTLGKNKSGNLEIIRDFISKFNVNFQVFPEYWLDGEKISSSIIRELIHKGEIIKANKFLSRNYFISGKVVSGEGRGTSLGSPTVNLSVDQKRILPRAGVYFTEIKISGELFRSITNIGYNPTISQANQLKIETFILNFQKDIYGEEVSLYFLKYLRNEKKFDSLAELKEQIGRDISAREKFI